MAESGAKRTRWHAAHLPAQPLYHRQQMAELGRALFAFGLEAFQHVGFGIVHIRQPGGDVIQAVGDGVVTRIEIPNRRVMRNLLARG